MGIIYHEKSKQFHLWNDEISYIIAVLPNDEIGHVYFGKRLKNREEYSYPSDLRYPKAMVCGMHDRESFSLELVGQENPSFGGTDLRDGAFAMQYANGSSVTHAVFQSFEIREGKPKLKGLPAAYTNEDAEAETLVIRCYDELTGLTVLLSYTIFRDYPIICRNVLYRNDSGVEMTLQKALSATLDLTDQEYEWMQFTGAWGREREPITRKLQPGITAIGSNRGSSSPNMNPFVILKRPTCDEMQGEALGFSLVYSGNFLAQAECDSYGQTRFMMGISPMNFAWKLTPGEEFQTPEAVLVYTKQGLNHLSRSLHHFYRNQLSRGIWKTKERPILLNNWEATQMNFTEESILKIAAKGKEAGVELFVLDDGWFGARDDDYRGLGDWVANTQKLPEGMGGLSRKINEMGLQFGFWIEPEMVNEDSDLYRAHPDWVLHVPGRDLSLGRHQLVLDYSKPEVVDCIYDMLTAVIDGANIAYIKWDMNRTITECYSIGRDSTEQGKTYHAYILGVYDLYERLTTRYPEILFESCASGGGRFDAGLLYYAPQAWCSDNTDAYSRLKIQYGTSYGYPLSSMGAHVSAVPNQQTGRSIDLQTRADVACFGTFGYELDLNELSDEEFEKVKEQIVFMKKYRGLLQDGDLYRLQSPFSGDKAAWMVVSGDRRQAILGYYTAEKYANEGRSTVRLAGLDPDLLYHVGSRELYGDELMERGIDPTDPAIGGYETEGDYTSRLFIIEA